MKKLKNISKKTIIIVLATLIMLIPNVKGYSSVGQFSSSSLAITANEQYPTHSDDRLMAVPAVVGAVILGAVLVGVFIAGLLDGWNAAGSQTHKSKAVFFYSLAEKKYNPNDFSKYDI